MMLATPYDVAYTAALPQETLATYAVYPPNQGFAQSVDVVVEGFPVDVRDREIRNFARFLPGFQVLLLYQPCFLLHVMGSRAWFLTVVLRYYRIARLNGRTAT